MKIMMDDNISTIDSDNLSSYLGDNSEHKPELVLNDYPTAQWISSFPDLDSVTGEQYTSVLDTQGNATGRLRIQSTLRAYGSTSLNGNPLRNAPEASHVSSSNSKMTDRATNSLCENLVAVVALVVRLLP